jgi:ribosomal protein L7/L12
LPAHIRAEIDSLVAEGKLINAIKALREHTGLGLKEAKGVIDNWPR